MSAPPSQSQFSADAYEDAPDWFQQFLADFNTSWGQVVDGIDGGLERGANIKGQAWNDVVVTAASAPAPDTAPFPLYLKLRDGFVPKHLVISKVTVASGAALPTTAIQPYWERVADGKRIKIRNLTGLTASAVYKFSFLAE